MIIQIFNKNGAGRFFFNNISPFFPIPFFVKSSIYKIKFVQASRFQWNGGGGGEGIDNLGYFFILALHDICF